MAIFLCALLVYKRVVHHSIDALLRGQVFSKFIQSTFELQGTGGWPGALWTDSQPTEPMNQPCLVPATAGDAGSE